MVTAIDRRRGRVHGIADVRGGYAVEADVVVVGSGPGGFVAADNLAASGMKVVLIEAGPEVKPEAMTREAPRFLAKYYWEGGLRRGAGPTPNPPKKGRCLGGRAGVNTANMLPQPQG
ncbi:MAG: FAD-dependent oxidoreductase, partial [Deltaproteobacteria bacterium]|nr:FAD-dependent oxidoreductase [Deltaproteobacteria bacterium]